MRKILVILLLGLFLISFASAFEISDESLGTFQKDSTVQLYQSCATCTYTNISSVKFPNGTILLINELMTKSGQDYIYDFNKTSQLENYFYTVCGDKNSILTCETIPFTITKTGLPEGVNQSVLYFGLILFAIFLFILSLYGSIHIPFKNGRSEEGVTQIVNYFKYAKLGLMFLSYVIFVWILNLIFTLSNNTNILSQYNAFFEVLFKVSMALSYPIFVFMIIIFSLVAIEDSKINKLLKRGLLN